MPRNYQSRGLRQQWSTEAMERAVMAVRNGDCSQNHAAKVYGVPRQTLRRYLSTENTDSNGGQSYKLGRKPELGQRAEVVLVNHIKKLSRHGFSLTRNDVRALAFNLAGSLNIDHRFNREEELAGWDWLWGFLKRHPGLSIRKEENLSLARALGMKREVVHRYFDLLERFMGDLNLMNRADRIFGLDESGFQLNTRAKEVVAPKGDRVVHPVAPKEKGETISIIGCFNAAGTYLPPCLIIKGVRTIVGLKERLPPGSEVFMNEKSAYATGDIFLKLLKYFVSYFRVTKVDSVMLVLDSHCSNPAVSYTHLDVYKRQPSDFEFYIDCPNGSASDFPSLRWI